VQDFEALKMLITNLSHHIDKAHDRVSEIEKSQKESSVEREALRQKVEQLQKAASQIEQDAKEFKVEVQRLLGENKKTVFTLLLALLGSGAYYGKAELLKIFGIVLGSK
jgi:predicted  nucleic acid-binding Zn-ribbon protein